jgi:hypothetical protein
MKIGHYVLLVGLSLFVACGNPAQPPPPEPPTVTLVSTPSTIIVGGSSKLTASVIAKNGVKEVEFFEGIVSLGKDSSAPFELLINAGFDTVGTRDFRAVVTDNTGLTGQADTRVVIALSNTAPVVTLSASPNPVVSGTSSTLTASVVATSGVQYVEFFEGATSLGKDLSSPFTIVINDFSVAGNRVFKAIATDNNGLGSENLVTVTAVDRIPTSFELSSKMRECIAEKHCFLSSPDVTAIRANYETGVISRLTNWAILKENGSPAPTDGSLGTIAAVPNDPNGLRSFQVQYIPPTLVIQSSFNISIEATSVQDPTQKRTFKVTVNKKKPIEAIELVASPSDSTIVNQSITLSVNLIGAVGSGNGFVEIQFSGLNNIGKLECAQGEFCTVNPDFSIIGKRFKFTGLQPGTTGFLVANSLDVKSDGSKPFSTIKLTVKP